MTSPYALLAVVGLGVTVSFLHTGGADHGSSLDDRLDKLERLLEQERLWRRELENKFEDKLQRALEEEKVELRKEMEAKFQAEKKEREELKKAFVAELKLVKEYCMVAQPTKYVETKRKEHSAKNSSHEVMPRADDIGGWEPVVGQMSQQLTQVSADVQALKTATQESKASVYVHWGRSVCPSSASLIYAGTAGGSYYTHTGAASNYLCLTLSPVYASHSIPQYVGYVYGGEYQTYDSHLEDDVPCAVCRPQRATTMMVPGTNQCPTGWTREYGGYLMAGYYDHPAASEYICVDTSFEDRPNGGADTNGKLFFFTITHCGALPCPPYENNKMVTCAVCSK